MFCHITENWRGRPLVRREVVVNLIGHTTTRTGLEIHAELNEHSYPTGREVTDQQMQSLSIKRDKFHGERCLNRVMQRVVICFCAEVQRLMRQEHVHGTLRIRVRFHLRSRLHPAGTRAPRCGVRGDPRRGPYRTRVAAGVSPARGYARRRSRQGPHTQPVYDAAAALVYASHVLGVDEAVIRATVRQHARALRARSLQ